LFVNLISIPEISTIATNHV